MIVALAFLIGVAALFLYAAVADVLRQRRRHRRIAKAHEPRPFRAQK